MEDFDVKSLVIYKESGEDAGGSTVLGVQWSRVLKVLFVGRKELCEELVPSQWGPVHLFDLCLRFGHIEIAWALALSGVKGCTLQSHHFGGFADALHDPFDECECNQGETCRLCCLGFPLENGVWMEDWNMPLSTVSYAAVDAVNTPLVSTILKIFIRNEQLPFAVSADAAARLLDIATLIGNVEAAVNLAKTSQARPLRRWGGQELCVGELPTISAALLAGADFQGLHVVLMDQEVPLLHAVALDFDQEQWQQLEQFFPLEKQWPTFDVELGNAFLFHDSGEDHVRLTCIWAEKISNALRAGWDLTHIWIKLYDEAAHTSDASLLDLAILCGQWDGAYFLASVGVELKVGCLHWHRQAIRGESLEIDAFAASNGCLDLGSPAQCKFAAAVATRAFLKASFKQEGIDKGIALYQTLANKFYPRGVPMPLVHDILVFSMEVPKILAQLDLWDMFKVWMPSMPVPACGNDKVSAVEDMEVEEPSGRETARETCRPSADPTEPVLSSDGVCLFRLKTLATSDHVTQVLLDARGPFWKLHQRVLEAGCQVDPEWNPIKALLVPIITEMSELQALTERGYKLSKQEHILALQSDYDLITEALRSICSGFRQSIAQLGPCQERALPDDPADLESLADIELLVIEPGIFPSPPL